jgi:hypothetical protein
VIAVEKSAEGKRSLKAGHSASCQLIIGPNREMSDTFARSVMDRVGDRSDRAYAHDFTNTLRTKRITSRRVMSGSPADMCTPVHSITLGHVVN